MSRVREQETLLHLLRRHWRAVLFVSGVALTSLAAHLLAGLGWEAAAFETLRVFTGNADPEMPDAPAGIQQTIWAVRFLAPASVALVAYDAARFFGVFKRVSIFWSGHVVIVGAGNLGTVLALRLRDAGVKVAVIEKTEDRAAFDELRSQGIAVLLGDATQADALHRARVQRASWVICVTGDDTVNLAAGLLAVSETSDRTGPRVSVHIVDAALRENVEKLANERRRLAIWNSYKLAADRLIAADLPAIRGAGKLVVIAGFGRFGRAVLDAIADQARDALPSVIVIDKRIPEQDVFEHAKRSRITVEFEQKSMRDKILWTRIEARSQSTSDPIPVFICTDNDGANLSCAFEITNLAGTLPVRLVTRLLHWKHGSKLASTGRAVAVEPVNLDDLIAEALHTNKGDILPMSLGRPPRAVVSKPPAATSSAPPVPGKAA